MDRAEAGAQIHALVKLIFDLNKDHQFTAADVCELHKTWLGEIYSWAGQYRQVNLTKGGFPFAAAAQIPALMDQFGQGPLRASTPCNFESYDEIAKAMAVVHTELLLIHPFRDGNGRVGRLLAVGMGYQAGLPSLDFGAIRGKKREEYFAAVQAGLDQNYEPMERVFRTVIERSLRNPYLKRV